MNCLYTGYWEGYIAGAIMGGLAGWIFGKYHGEVKSTYKYFSKKATINTESFVVEKCPKIVTFIEDENKEEKEIDQLFDEQELKLNEHHEKFIELYESRLKDNFYGDEENEYSNSGYMKLKSLGMKPSEVVWEMKYLVGANYYIAKDKSPNITLKVDKILKNGKEINLPKNNGTLPSGYYKDILHVTLDDPHYLDGTISNSAVIVDITSCEVRGSSDYDYTTGGFKSCGWMNACSDMNE